MESNDSTLKSHFALATTAFLFEIISIYNVRSSFQLLNVFAKSTILDEWLGFEYIYVGSINNTT